MKVINAAIESSTTIFVAVIIVAIIGTYAYFVLPRESDPEIIVPIIRTVVAYQGVAPEDMESLVTVPIERELTGISGVKEIRSSSLEGQAAIVVEFNPNVDIDDALQKVRDKVDQAKADLPQDADDPSVSEINISELPIIFVSLTGDVGLAALTEVAKKLEDRLEALPGVLEVDRVGDVEREIQIEVDPDRVAQYGISLADLVTITRLENVNTPGGAMELGEAKYVMRVPGEFKSPDELTGLVVKQGLQGTVYLRDIATVRDGFKELDSYSRVDGKQAVTLTISKRSGENIIAVSDRVREVINDARDRLPPGMDLAVTMDEADDIRMMVGDLESGMLSGLILVLAVILIFMGFVSSVFVSVAIPLSMMITFAYFLLDGISLNMVTLFSLILALGMLVDNGIVVVENIYRHMQMGMGRVEAAKAGADEVAWPVIGSTLTTVVAFVPMFFWPGIWGKFMVFLPKTACTALMGSLFVGLIVNPAMAARWLPRPKRLLRIDSDTPYLKRHRLIEAYGRLVRQALHWRAVTVMMYVVLLAVLSVLYLTRAQVEFFPEVEPERAHIDIDCPQGTNMETSDRYVKYVEQVVEPYRDTLDHVIANVGSRGASRYGGSSSSSSHLSRVTLDFPKTEECRIRPSQILNELRESLAGVSGADIRVQKAGMGPSEKPPVNIEISGDDFPTLAQLAEEVQRTIKDVPHMVDLRDDYDKGKPEVKVIIDRQQAWKTGLNTQFIGMTVKAAVDGRKAGDYREGDEDYDVMVRFPKTFREDLSNIMSMNLINLQGKAIPFSSVARVEQGAGLGSVTRIDRKRTVTVSAEVEGATPPKVLEDVKAALMDFALPAGYTISYTGQNTEQEEAQAFLIKAFIAALLLIALVLVYQFNSIVTPLIIMSSVILSTTGVFIGLIAFNLPFDIIMTGIGCTSLAGVVVNNAIVLLDFINQLRARGVPTEDAIVQAGMIRFRPVMLTAITAILGLVPMAIGVSFDFRELKWIVGSQSSQWWQNMSVAVIFGLGFATMLTLVVVPTLYSFMVSAQESFRRTRAADGAVAGPSAEVPAK